MTLDQLLNQKLLLVVVNNTTCYTSTKEQISTATLGYWKVDLKKAIQVDYIIGVRHGIAVSCYKIDRIEIRKSDGRALFKSEEDLSDIIRGINLKDLGVRKGYKEIQYINL